MVHADEEPSTTTPKVPNPTTLRLGELEPSIATRMAKNVAAGAIAKREIGRYYAVLADSLLRTHFTLTEAEAVAVALQDFDPASIRYLWAEVEDRYRAKDEAEKTDEPPPFGNLPTLDVSALVNKLRNLTLAQAYAVLDAAERYWTRYIREAERDGDDSYKYLGSAEPWTQLVIDVGLVHPVQAERDQKKRAQQAEHASAAGSEKR